MVRTIISTFTLSALIAGTANYMVEKALAPKKKAIKLAGITSIVNTVSAMSKTNELAILPPLELDHEAFIPNENSGWSTVEESKMAKDAKRVSFISIDKKKTVESVLRLNDAPKRLVKADDVKTFAINGETPVKLHAFKNFKAVKASNLVANFKPLNIEGNSFAQSTELKIASVKNFPAKSKASALNQITTKTLGDDKSSKTELDRISTGMAATEKSMNKNSVGKNSVAQKSQPLSEELVFFDYSVKNDEEVKKKESPSLASKQKANLTSLTTSSTVSGIALSKGSADSKKDELIKSIMKNMGKGFEKTAKKRTVGSYKVAGKNKQAIEDAKKAIFNANEKSAKTPFKKRMNTQNYKSLYRLTIQSQRINGKSEGRVLNYDVRFKDDLDDIYPSDAEGVVEFENLLNSDYAVRKGTIFASGHYPLTTDFVLESSPTNLTVPLITNESFAKMLESKNLTGIGGHILVELDELTEDIELELDSNYEAKIFLDRNLRVVERSESDYSFIMFVGVASGNRIISFKTYKNQVTSKIIHVVEDEIYFDFNFYAEEVNDQIDFYEEHLLSKETGILSIDEDEIVDLAFETKFVKKTVNTIEAKKALYPVGTRKYYELSHLDEKVFVGRWGSSYIDVPSESYIRFAYSNFKGYPIEDSCLVQINLEKQAKELSYSGQTYKGQMLITPRILDTDGVFYSDLSDESKRIFLLGENQGSINVKVKYVDNSVDYLQTFCSKANYVVEQL